MEVLAGFDFVNLFLHLDTYLKEVVSQYHGWVYLLLFLVVFCETGLVVMPFLPGDSLLFAAGAVAALPGSELDATRVFVLLGMAAVVGDSTNYWIGRFVGPKIFRKEKVRFLNRKHLERAHEFYQKHGRKTVVIARFMPILRTFAPFVAGIGRMEYWQFLSYSVIGTVAWVSTFTLAGFYFGSKLGDNFPMIIMGIIGVSLLPAGFAFIRERIRARAAAQTPKA